MKVWDMEIEIPIPKDGNEYDWDVVFQAWWIVILEVYRYKAKYNKAPVKTTLEMRIMNGSNIIMAPQRGNDLTCSIEILTKADTFDSKKEVEEW